MKKYFTMKQNVMLFGDENKGKEQLSLKIILKKDHIWKKLPQHLIFSYNHNREMFGVKWHWSLFLFDGNAVKSRTSVYISQSPPP